MIKYARKLIQLSNFQTLSSQHESLSRLTSLTTEIKTIIKTTKKTKSHNKITKNEMENDKQIQTINNTIIVPR